MRDSGECKDLAHLRKFNQNKLVVAHIKINSLRKKFDFLLILKQKLAKDFPTVNSKLIVLETPIE